MDLPWLFAETAISPSKSTSFSLSLMSPSSVAMVLYSCVKLPKFCRFFAVFGTFFPFFNEEDIVYAHICFT